PNFALQSSPRNITAADFNRDGKFDIAVDNPASRSLSIGFGDGRGSFAVTNFLNGTQANAVAPDFITSGDFNGDGNPDLAVLGGAAGGLLVHLGNGAGGFAAPDSYAVGAYPYAIAAGELNGDGRLDLVVANRE